MYDNSQLDASATTLQLAKMFERQHLCMPTVSSLRAQDDHDSSDETAERLPYDLPPYFPSSLPTRTPCTTKLQAYEFRLREGQAHEALEDICQHLRLRTHLHKHKDKNVVGQRANTRSSIGFRERLAQLCTHERVMRLQNYPIRWARLAGRTTQVGTEDIRPLKDGEEGDSERKGKETVVDLEGGGR